MWWKLGALLLALPFVVYLGLVTIYGRVGALERILGPLKREPVDFAVLQIKPSPNQYLVCPPGLCQLRPHEESPVFDVPLEELRVAWLRMIQKQPRVTLLASDPDEQQYEYQALTAVIHFPDAVTVRLLSTPSDQSTLAIYSRSHYGYGDLGENRRRVRAWLDQLSRELGNAR
jgi:uncharacterized protein (DUF1499 family)